MSEKTLKYNSELLEILKNALSPETLVINVANYYQKILPQIPFIVIAPGLINDSFRIIFSNGDEQDIKNQFMKIIESSTGFAALENNSVFIFSPGTKRPDYMCFFTSSVNTIHPDIVNEFTLINAFYHSLDTTTKHNFVENHNQCANLISHVTHDMSSLLSFLDEADSGGQLRDKTGYMETLLPQILLFIREIELVRVKVDVDDLLSGIIETHQNSDNIMLESFDGTYKIACDVELINQAFSEILDNAIQAGQDSNKKIQIRVKIQRTLPIFHDNHFLQVQIIDSGFGIPEEYMQLVFNPFFTTKKTTGHAGFGLSIARKIIEAHHGYINISSKQDSGCITSVFLPLEMDKYEKK